MRAALALAFLGAGAADARAADEPPPTPVFVSASHHEVLAHWLDAVREGRLPASGVTVVHVDAHPDLAVPRRDLPRRPPARPADAVRRLDIASFQLAAVWMGVVDRVVWLRPDWATQLADGTRRFRVGRIPSGGLRVDDASDYYVLDDAWAPGDALEEPRRLSLRVLPLSRAHSALRLGEAPWILDVDLDAFATRNPAAEALREAGIPDPALDELRRIFAPEALALPAEPRARIAALESLLGALDDLSALRWASVPGALLALRRAGLSAGDLWTLLGILWDAPDAAAQEALLREGRELVGLPERRGASPGEIRATASAIGALLATAGSRPRLVTVARSVEDGYTPAAVWPAAEWTLLEALAGALGLLRVRLDPGLPPAPRPAAASAAGGGSAP